MRLRVGAGPVPVLVSAPVRVCPCPGRATHNHSGRQEGRALGGEARTPDPCAGFRPDLPKNLALDTHPGEGPNWVCLGASPAIYPPSSPPLLKTGRGAGDAGQDRNLAERERRPGIWDLTPAPLLSH